MCEQGCGMHAVSKVSFNTALTLFLVHIHSTHTFTHIFCPFESLYEYYYVCE